VYLVIHVKFILCYDEYDVTHVLVVMLCELLVNLIYVPIIQIEKVTYFSFFFLMIRRPPRSTLFP